MSIQHIKDWGLPTTDPVSLVQAAKNHDPYNGRPYSMELSDEDVTTRVGQLLGKCPETTNGKHLRIVYGYALQETLRGNLTGEDLYNDVLRRASALIKESPWAITIYETYESPTNNGEPKLDAAGNPKQKKGAKRAKAIEVYKANEHKTMTRQEWIALLMEEVGLTKAGASTYYAGLKKGTMK